MFFPAPVVVRFAPTELAVGQKSIPCDPAHGAAPWHGAAAQLKDLDLGRARVTVELSAHFVRYALVPWNDALATPAEEEAYLRHHFAKIHGERAKLWAFRASDAAPGEARVASAVDAALVEALKKIFAEKPGARLVSIQPALMSRFNAVRALLPALGAWLVLAEPERACIALHGQAGWRSVQSVKGDWRPALERERYRIDGEVPSLVLLAGAEPPANDAVFQFRAVPA